MLHALVLRVYTVYIRDPVKQNLLQSVCRAQVCWVLVFSVCFLTFAGFCHLEWVCDFEFRWVMVSFECFASSDPDLDPRRCSTVTVNRSLEKLGSGGLGFRGFRGFRVSV